MFITLLSECFLFITLKESYTNTRCFLWSGSQLTKHLEAFHGDQKSLHVFSYIFRREDQEMYVLYVQKRMKGREGVETKLI